MDEQLGIEQAQCRSERRNKSNRLGIKANNDMEHDHTRVRDWWEDLMGEVDKGNLELDQGTTEK